MSTYNGEAVDLEALNGIEELLQLKLGQDNDTVAAPRSAVSNDNQAVNVTKGKKTEGRLCPNAKLSPRDCFVCCELQDVRDDVPV